MKTHWIKIICLIALIATLFGAALTIKPLPKTTLAVAEKEPEALNLPAPELLGGPWINTAGGKAIHLAGRRGKVAIVEFWTFACSNCLANLPAYANWQKQFADKDVVVIGVHTPETESERVTANVVRRVKQLGITYPILVDQEHENWDRWQVEAWPTVYLVDKQGRIRYRWVGELNYRNAGGETKLGQRVEQLLKEESVKAGK
jgi:peroxiredoxin